MHSARANAGLSFKSASLSPLISLCLFLWIAILPACFTYRVKIKQEKNLLWEMNHLESDELAQTWSWMGDCFAFLTIMVASGNSYNAFLKWN